MTYDGKPLDIMHFNCVHRLVLPLGIDGKFDPKGKPTEMEKFAVGNLAGIEMAIQNAKDKGFDGFRNGDYVTFLCTEIQPAAQAGFSDMPLFQIDISDRPPLPPPPEETKTQTPSVAV